MPIGILHERLSITASIAGTGDTTHDAIGRGRRVRIGIGDARLARVDIRRTRSWLAAIRDGVGSWPRYPCIACDQVRIALKDLAPRLIRIGIRDHILAIRSRCTRLYQMTLPIIEGPCHGGRVAIETVDLINLLTRGLCRRATTPVGIVPLVAE